MSRVTANDVLLAMSGSYRTPTSISAGCDASTGASAAWDSRGGNWLTGSGGDRHHRHHHRGFRGRGLGGGWGYFDREPGVVIEEAAAPLCPGALYAPSGHVVCPGDPGYEELRRSTLRHQASGADPTVHDVQVHAGETWQVWIDFSRTPSPAEVTAAFGLYRDALDVEGFSAPDETHPTRLRVTVTFKKDESIGVGSKVEVPTAGGSPLTVTVLDAQKLTDAAPPSGTLATTTPKKGSVAAVEDKTKTRNTLLLAGGGAVVFLALLAGRKR